MLIHVKTTQEEVTLEKLLTADDVSAITGLTTRALAQMRYLGTGPAFRKLSARTIRYAEADVVDYIESARRTSTRQTA